VIPLNGGKGQGRLSSAHFYTEEAARGAQPLVRGRFPSGGGGGSVLARGGRNALWASVGPKD
jgi:hypothetical protein